MQAVHDYLAIYIINAALEMGINVPNNLSVIGFDNIESSKYLEVPLTTINQDFRKMGEEAGSLIIESINNSSFDNSKRITLPVELIERSSTTRKRITALI